MSASFFMPHRRSPVDAVFFQVRVFSCTIHTDRQHISVKMRKKRPHAAYPVLFSTSTPDKCKPCFEAPSANGAMRPAEFAAFVIFPLVCGSFSGRFFRRCCTGLE